MYFIEIKNCEGTAENQDAWRRHYSGTKNMNTLASEVALKVAHTCACLAGVATYAERKEDDARLLDYAYALHAPNIASLEKSSLCSYTSKGIFLVEHDQMR